jgi:two-component system, LytTR family, sensor kinase
MDVALQNQAQGVPVWWAVPNSLLALAPGAVLTPAVFLAFEGLLGGRRRLLTRALIYAGIGIVFWLVWSLMVFGLSLTGAFFGTAEDVGSATLLLRQVAGISFNSLILYSVMVMVHEAVRHVREAQRQELRTSRLQAELARARTAALRAQLNPHFLFNTLHVASGLMSRDVGGARRVLRDLGELLRGSLGDSGAQLVPLRDEIQLVERYVGIQRARFGDRLQVEIDIDPDTHDLGVPPLLLQPLVENAVIHGISRREEGGLIRISTARDAGRVCLAVADSGAGLPGGATTLTRERVGIGGTRARLGLLFGDEATLRFVYPPGGGFRVDVLMPEIPMGSPEDVPAQPATAGEGAP